MKNKVIILFLLAVSCSFTNRCEDEIIGTWNLCSSSYKNHSRKYLICPKIILKIDGFGMAGRDTFQWNCTDSTIMIRTKSKDAFFHDSMYQYRFINKQGFVELQLASINKEHTYILSR